MSRVRICVRMFVCLDVGVDMCMYVCVYVFLDVCVCEVERGGLWSGVDVWGDWQPPVISENH